MTRLLVSIWAGLTLLSIGPTAAAEKCGSQTAIQMESEIIAPFDVAIEPLPVQIPLNEPFDLTVTICAKEGLQPEQMTIDATMPAHKHGMNYLPKTSIIEGGKYEVNNMLFHMPGVWRIEVTVYEEGSPHRFIHDVKLR